MRQVLECPALSAAVAGRHTVDRIMQTIQLFAGKSSSGRPVFEEVPVVDAGGGRLKVLRTPGLVLGIARDDEIRLGSQTGSFTVEKRGGRVAVQLYLGQAEKNDVESLSAQLAEAVSATWDGFSEKQAVFSFPASEGFLRAEELLNRFAQAYPEAEWYYGNVYAEDGVSPLNWWLDD